LYRDELKNLENKNIDEKLCYYVEAKESFNEHMPNQNNTVRSNSECITVVATVDMPEAFTPNGDGLNDIYRPQYTFNPTKIVFKVYDRAGAPMFETTDYNKGWDGKTSTGQKAPQGVYVYYLKFIDSSGATKEQNGFFTLINPK